MASEQDTQTFLKVTNEDSKFFGVSVRSWLVMLLVGTICGTHIAITLAVAVDAVIRNDFSKIGTFANIGEPLYGLSMIGVGFYFGKATNKSS